MARRQQPTMSPNGAPVRRRRWRRWLAVALGLPMDTVGLQLNDKASLELLRAKNFANEAAAPA